MSGSIKNEEHYYTKEFDNYNNSEDNFVANQELTATITMNEYRSLVTSKAIADHKIKEAQADRYELSKEIERLKAENMSLKERIYDLNEPDKKATKESE